MIRIENLHMHYRTERGEVYAVRDINRLVERGRGRTTATCCRSERLAQAVDSDSCL